MTQKREKQSESLEIRLGYTAKREFMDFAARDSHRLGPNSANLGSSDPDRPGPDDDD